MSRPSWAAPRREGGDVTIVTWSRLVHESLKAAAAVAEHTGARVRRLGAPRIPVGYGTLEDASRFGADRIAEAVRRFVRLPETA